MIITLFGEKKDGDLFETSFRFEKKDNTKVYERYIETAKDLIKKKGVSNAYWIFWESMKMAKQDWVNVDNFNKFI